LQPPVPQLLGEIGVERYGFLRASVLQGPIFCMTTERMTLTTSRSMGGVQLGLEALTLAVLG
jgi:hypothetical protein